jgi:hypothetical protein
MPVPMPAIAAPTARELRRDLRTWRRRRATAKLSDVISDAYIALFALVMFGSMLVSVLVNLSHESDQACASTGCLGARALLPWLVAGSVVVAVLVVARLLGPVFVSPAVGSWLLPTPAGRADLLRPRFVLAVTGSALAGAAVAAGGGTLGGLDPAAVAVLSVGTAAVGVCAVGAATVAQAKSRISTRVLAWALAALIWGTLVAADLHHPLLATPARSIGPGWWAGLAAGVVLAIATSVAAWRALDELPSRRVTPGGALVPGFSGALAGLDLSLAYDVVAAHRGRDRGWVRSRRGGPGGLGALVRLDVVRLRRDPGSLVILLAGLAVPAAATTAGGGRVVILTAALVGFVAGLPLLTGLRVVSRTPSLVRFLPFTTFAIRRAAVSVPAGCLLVFGLASTPILHAALDDAWNEAALTGIAVAASALASGIRWMSAQPPDYARPLVSTPAGGVPTNLYGSIFRGFDVLLVSMAPVLLSTRPQAAIISVAISLAVAAFLLGRDGPLLGRPPTPAVSPSA